MSVERSVTRLLGVDGADDLEVPLPNVLVDHVHDRGGLGRGVAYWLGNAMLQTGPLAAADRRGGQRRRARPVASSQVADEGAIRERVTEECAERLREISARFDERRAMRERLGETRRRRCATC